MANDPRTPAPDEPAGSLNKVFADLRSRNARVASMLDAKRKRHLERVRALQRKHRIHQAR
jgi:hypothetical protein